MQRTPPTDTDSTAGGGDLTGAEETHREHPERRQTGEEQDQAPSTKDHGAAGDAPTLRDPEALVVWEAERALRRTEARRACVLLRYVDTAASRAAVGEDSAVDEETARQAAVMYAAEAMGASENYLLGLLHTAEQVREKLPSLWAAFQAGRIPYVTLNKIAKVLDTRLTDTTLAALDAEAPAYACDHRPGQVQNWVKRFIAAHQPEAAAEAFNYSASRRYVCIRDLDNSMSILTAMVPTVTAHAIRRRLHTAARSPHQPIPHNPLLPEHQQHSSSSPTHASWEDELPESARQLLDKWNTSGELHLIDGKPSNLPPQLTAELTHPPHHQGRLANQLPQTRAEGDPRTLQQREADLLTCWLLTGETSESTPLQAHIGILVPEATLTGKDNQPGTTSDGTTGG